MQAVGWLLAALVNVPFWSCTRASPGCRWRIRIRACGSRRIRGRSLADGRHSARACWPFWPPGPRRAASLVRPGAWTARSGARRRRAADPGAVSADAAVSDRRGRGARRPHRSPWRGVRGRAFCSRWAACSSAGGHAGRAGRGDSVPSTRRWWACGLIVQTVAIGRWAERFDPRQTLANYRRVMRLNTLSAARAEPVSAAGVWSRS